ncbi:MAG: sigma-70 family RNA polymerase sigma factor [Clostridia bacterium]|nr:sigma-70 family RNA polymerase sigma factor [Clostridia bacterium]
MTEEQKIKKAKEYLSSYAFYQKCLNASRYEREFFGAATSGDEVFLGAKLFEIREFVSALPNCPEKLFLSCHYLRGHSVEKTAELMDMSPRNAYRLKKRALALAASRLEIIHEKGNFPEICT